MSVRLLLTSCLLFGASAFLTNAQGAQKTLTGPIAGPDEFGTVTGRVVCSDTQRPARLAEVSFVPAADGSAEPVGKAPGTDVNGSLPPVETDLDGRFVQTKLKPGLYYIRVDLDGYLTPILGFSREQLEHPTPEVRKRLQNELTEVRVQPHAPADVQLSIAPGASLSGTVLYDDGTPGIGISVDLLGKDAKGDFTKQVNTGKPVSPTDEHGHFHLSSLPPGDYVAEAAFGLWEQIFSTVPTPTGGMLVTMPKSIFELSVFSGDVFRPRDAVPFKLNPGEDRTGLAMTLPLGKLHRVSGSVVAKDGHALDSGKVLLRYADDNSGLTGVDVNRDTKQFVFPYIPEGTYTLTVEGAADVTEIQVSNGPEFTPTMRLEEKTLHKYGKIEQPLIVQSDLEGVVVTVPDGEKKKSATATAAIP